MSHTGRYLEADQILIHLTGTAHGHTCRLCSRLVGGVDFLLDARASLYCECVSLATGYCNKRSLRRPSASARRCRWARTVVAQKGTQHLSSASAPHWHAALRRLCCQYSQVLPVVVCLPRVSSLMPYSMMAQLGGFAFATVDPRIEPPNTTTRPRRSGVTP